MAAPASSKPPSPASLSADGRWVELPLQGDVRQEAFPLPSTAHPMNEVRILIIGSGKMGQAHAQAFRKVPGAPHGGDCQSPGRTSGQVGQRIELGRRLTRRAWRQLARSGRAIASRRLRDCRCADDERTDHARGADRWLSRAGREAGRVYARGGPPHWPTWPPSAT